MGNICRGNNMNDNLVELIGIIEGVNYDGVINDLEIEKLQSWLAHNRQFRNDKIHTIFTILFSVFVNISALVKNQY